mgnify:CR=1 FL=1
MCSGILPFVILILINLFQTRMKKQLISVMVAASLLTACGGAPKTTAEAEKFDYTVEQFADLQILRYRVPEFENLSLKQKELVYYLTEAALQGRDILFDQNGKYNLRIRRMLEAVYTGYTGDKSAADFSVPEAGMVLQRHSSSLRLREVRTGLYSRILQASPFKRGRRYTAACRRADGGAAL